jgi:hypothetical protein
MPEHEPSLHPSAPTPVRGDHLDPFDVILMATSSLLAYDSGEARRVPSVANGAS